MKAWIIYNKNGKAKCETRKLEYNGEFMGACSVSVTISSPTPIGFELGDWMEYRGERFELNYDPSVVKEASSGSYGEAFVYENVVFNSLSDELTRCAFLDYVPADNEIHYSALPTFSFFADSVKKLAERIQANLDRVYKNEKRWTVRVDDEHKGVKNVNVSVSNNSVWEALGFVNTLFDTNFIIRGREITIGTSGLAVGNLFSYGMGNGLYKIERNADSSQQIITRLYAYGSTKNLPEDYYLHVEDGMPNNMAVKNLMLPSFPEKAYIDSPNIGELGVREGVVFFDGSNEMEEIFPTMEGMTAEKLKAAGISVNATGALDVIESAENPTDNGVAPEEGKGEALKATFKVRLKDVGFDINDYLSTDGAATLSMKDGMCGGREFEITSCKEVEGGGYELTCNRVFDDVLGLYFPHSGYPIRKGDKFVLLNIGMPSVYVKEAAQRLLKAAEAYLDRNDFVRYTYVPTVDNIFLAREHDEAVKDGRKSIYDTIKEGDLMLFEDDDLGVDNGSVTIASLSIKEDMESSLIPEYGITLQDKKSVGTLTKIQNQLANLATYGGGSVNTEQVQSIVEAVGKKLFLSKTKDDRSKGTIASDKGFEVGKFAEGTLGTGGAMYLRDGSSYSEVDFLKVRKKAMFTEITIQELKHVGGEIILSPAAMVCSNVEEVENGWKCYFEKEDADGRRVYQEFEAGDLARCQTFNLSPRLGMDYIGNHYYWRLVTEVGEDYIVLSNRRGEYDTFSDAPLVGDHICQMGNVSDTDRQNAILLSAFGTDAPSYKQYRGISSFDLNDAELVTRLSPFGNLIKGEFISETTNKNIEDVFNEAKVDWDKVLEQTDKEFTMWYEDYAPTMNNRPAVDWVTDELKELHLEDLFYDTSTGYAYRFEKSQGSVYKWELVSDEQTIKALQAAADAQHTADGKIRNFGSQPTPPYDEGDRWCNATYGELFDNDDLVCVQSKAEGEEFSIEDWRAVSYGTTAVIKNTEKEINLLVGSFELEDGTYYLKTEAGLKITDKVAGLYVTQDTYDTFASRTNTSISRIESSVGNISATVSNIQWNNNKEITNIDKSGLVVESNYATLFSAQMKENKLVTMAEVRTEVENGVSAVKITADKVTINGFANVGNNQMSIGGFTINNDYMQAGSSAYSGIMTLSSSALGFKADGNEGIHVLIGPGSLGTAGTCCIYADAGSGGGYSIYGFGDANLFGRKRQNESVLIGGLALTYANGDHDNLSTPLNAPDGVWTNFLFMEEDTKLPAASLCKGKLIFVKCKSGKTLTVENCVVASSASVGTKTWENNDLRGFFSNGTNWYELFLS